MASQSASLRASCAYGMGILLLTSDKQVYGLRAGARHVSRGAAHGAGARGAPCCLRARFSKTRRPGWVPARCPARHGRCLGALSSISASKRAARRSGASRFSARRLGAPPVQARNVVLLSPRLQPVRSLIAPRAVRVRSTSWGTPVSFALELATRPRGASLVGARRSRRARRERGARRAQTELRKKRGPPGAGG